MLTSEDIILRRTNYICCALSFLAKAIEAEMVGDSECFAKNMDLFKYMRMAHTVMVDTPAAEGEDGCTDIEYASIIAAMADCYCSSCGCEGQQPPPSADPCIVTPDYTVIDAVDVQDRTAIDADTPSEGDAYLVVTDTGAATGWAVNNIYTYTSGSWVATPIANGDIVNAGGVLWTTLGFDTPGPLYPEIVFELFEFDNVYTVQSSAPQIALFSTREATVRGYIGGVWTTLFSGPETDIAVPQSYSLAGLPITAIQVIYTDGPCKVTAGSIIIPPLGGCGEIDASVTAESDCGTGTFNVIVDIESVSGWPLGGIIYTINGITQPVIPATLGVTLLGPFANDSTVTVRVTNAQDSECDFDAGTFTDPNAIVPDFTVFSAKDASFEGSADLGVAYLIVSDTTDAGNTWASNVGSIWNGAIFIPTSDGDIIQATDTAGQAAYWMIVDGVPEQLYPEVILTFTGGYPAPWTLVSTNPTDAAGRYRVAAVEMLVDGDWSIFWAGFENSLASAVPVTLPATPVPEDIRVSYYGGQCPVTVGGTVISGNVVNESACGPIQYYSYDYTPGGDSTTWLWTNTTPGATMTIWFAQGSINPLLSVIRLYDGTDNSGTLLAASTVPALNGLTATTVGQSLYMEMDIAADDTDPQETTWIFQVSCTPGAVSPDMSVTQTEDCPNYEFSLEVETLFIGDGPSATLRYVVNGGTPIEITGIADFDINVIGPFPYESVVVLYAVNPTDEAATRILGQFTGSGTCDPTADPCAPNTFIKVNFDGDVTDIPDPPYDGATAALFYVRTDNTNTGTWAPGSILEWNIGTGEWEFLVTAPLGAIIYGPTSGSYWVFNASGIVDYFPAAIISPLVPAVDTNNFKARMEQVENGSTTTNRPIRIEVFSSGVWVPVWVGTEQMFVTYQELDIPEPFTISRTVYNYDTCAYDVSAIMDIGAALEIGP